MADILIKNMELPKSCYSDEFKYCPFLFFDYDTKSHCELSDDIRCTKTRRPNGCPLVELPSHGDLIPYHAVRKAIVNYFGKDNTEWCDMMDEIDKIDVVVEGSRGSDN